MAKPNGKKSATKVNSTTHQPTSNKQKSKSVTVTVTVSDGDEIPTQPVLRETCNPCGDYPAGTILFCEDGVLTPLTPPSVASYLRIDPNGSGLPHWEPE